MPTRYFQTNVSGDGTYTGERTWSGEQINVAWDKFDYNSSNHSLWALDGSGHLQYRSAYSDYAGRYNTDDLTLSDYFFETTIEPAGSGNYEVGFMFRFKDRYSFYYLVMNGGYQDWGTKNIRLRKVSGSNHYTLREIEHPPFVTKTDYKFRCELSGANIKIWLNDVLIIDYTDSNPILNGAWGPWVKGQEFTKWKFITAKSNSRFTAKVTLSEQSVTNDKNSPDSAQLVDTRTVGEILEDAVQSSLAGKTYESYSIHSYRISSTESKVKVIFDRTLDLQITNDPNALIYAYQQLPTAPPTEVTNLQVTAITHNSATYTWTHSDDSEDGFLIIDGHNNVIATVGENVTSYTETGLQEGTSYERKVIAFNTAGNSSDSNLVVFTTSDSPPITPNDFWGEVISDDEIKWYWTNAPNEKSYELIRWDESGNIHVVAIIDKDVTSYNETGLTPDTEYTRGIRAVNTYGKSDPSLPFTVRTKAPLPEPPDLAPANFFGVGVAEDKILWYWEDTTNNETGFEMYDEHDNFIALLPANEYSFTEMSLSPSSIYRRKIRAINEGGEGPFTDLATARTLGMGQDFTGKPVSPINLTVEVHNSHEATLNWEYNEHPMMEAQGFKLYTSSGEFIMGFPKDYREFLMKNLQPSRTYRFYLVAYNELGDSLPSNTVTFMTPHVYDPFAPSPELDKLPDPYEGVLYDRETADTGKIEAFQSGVGDQLDLKVHYPSRKQQKNEESFSYDLYIKGLYDVLEDWYPAQEIYYQVTCKGHDSKTGEDFEKKSEWIKGVINGSKHTPDGKKPFISSLGMQIPITIVNRRYSVEVKDKDGNIIPIYNPLSPANKINWTISEDTNDASFDADSLSVSKVDIFNNWSRFSHNASENQPANEAETKSWLYDEETGTIRSTVNSVTHIGFYSEETSDNFELDVKFRVDDPPGEWKDNDRIGVVIAFKKDENGREHTLTAIRNNDNPNFTWSIFYNFARSDQKRIADASPYIPLVDAWSNYPLGSRIKVVRKNDIIEAWTSQMDSHALVEEAKLTIDLSSDPVLEIFREPTAYGISCMSQKNVVFDELLFTNYTASFAAGSNSTIVAWSEEKGKRTITKTWRSAKMKGKRFEIQEGDLLTFKDSIQKPSYDVLWKEINDVHPIYAYTMVVDSDNPNVDVYLDVEVVNFFPDEDYIDVTLKARVLNTAQTSWYPWIHNGYYYLNQMEHFLFSDDRVRVKDAAVQSANIFSFPYTITAYARRYYQDTEMSYSDDSKQEFLQGVLESGISLDLYDNALTLAEDAEEGVFVSRLFDYVNQIQDWDPLEVVQDETMIEGGASLKVEVGIANASGEVSDWYEQNIGQPIQLPDKASKIRYRLTLKEGETRRDFVKKFYHTNAVLERGKVLSDKLFVEDNTIQIDSVEYNKEARYVSTTMTFGSLINEMGFVNMGIYLGENSKVRVYTASSDNPNHDFTNPTADSPWIPVELVRREDELHVFRNRAARKAYVALIIELERGEIEYDGVTDYSTPVVYDISVEPHLYEYIRTAPVIDRVTIGGFAPAGYIDETHNVSLIGELNTDGKIHEITTDTVENIVLDHLAEIGIKNINELAFSYYELKWDTRYPIELETEPAGQGVIKGYAYDDVGKAIEQNIVAYFDKEDHRVLVSPIPQSGAPVIVKNARNELLRHVHFRDSLGKPTLINREYHETNETRYIFLEHYNIDPESLRVWIDLNEDGEWHQQFNCKVAENRLILPNLYEIGKVVKVEYKIKDSFCIDYNYNSTQDLAEIKVHTPYDEDYKETRRLEIKYEVNKESSYYVAKEVDLNPLRTRLNSGFLYLTDTIYPPHRLEIQMNPTRLYKSRPDSVTINAKVLDEFGNPVVGEIVEFSPSIGTIQIKNRRTDLNGLVTAIFSAPQDVGENEVTINVRVLAKNLKYQLEKDVTIELANEVFVEKIAIIPDATDIERGETIGIKIVAMGANDERVPNKTIQVKTSLGEIAPESGITNGLGEFFAYLTAPIDQKDSNELALLTAEMTDEQGDLIQEQALINVLKSNVAEVIT